MNNKKIANKQRKKELVEELKLEHFKMKANETPIRLFSSNKKVYKKLKLMDKPCSGLLVSKTIQENGILSNNESPPLMNTNNSVTKKMKKVKEKNTISTMAKEALERGGGRACKATHGKGCRHYGVLDLRGMDTKTYLYYAKEGGWIYNKSCNSCRKDTKDMTMDKGSRYYLRYCEMGLKGLKYNINGCLDERDLFEDHNCDMLLCVQCWNMKVLEHEEDVKGGVGASSRRCSARKKL